MATIHDLPSEILRLILFHLYVSYIRTDPIPALPDPYDRSAFWNAVGDRMSWIKSRDNEKLHRKDELVKFMTISSLWKQIFLQFLEYEDQ